MLLQQTFNTLSLQSGSIDGDCWLLAGCCLRVTSGGGRLDAVLAHLFSIYKSLEAILRIFDA